MKSFLLSFFLFTFCNVYSNEINGTVTDTKNNRLAYASILVKGTGIGTTANAKGEIEINLSEGNFTLICQHIGYKSVEKKIKVSKESQTIHFVLEEQQYNLNEVVIKSGSEDPAYEIIRNAIKKRVEHLNEIKKIECEVYVKGQIQLRDFPKRFFGEKVDFEDGDTSKKKVIFLSESVAKYSTDGRDKRKVEVISTRVSGRSDGFGFSSPQIVSFYQNSISVGRGLNPRGFLSPISDNALHYYKYKYEGSFVENNKLINRIKVIPKRNYEPLFSGYINIIEDEWRIFSTDLMLLKEQQMQFLDTLKIQQLYVPLNNMWVIKQQVIYPAGKFFNFDFFGNIIQIYNKINLNPTFKKGFFDNVVLKFEDSSNKKTIQYWDSVRPLPLLEIEEKDFIKKDSLEQVRKDPKYLDSIDRKNNKINILSLMLRGQTFNNSKNKSSFKIDPILTSFFQYNTVEGLVSNITLNYIKRFNSPRESLQISPTFRYGFSNKHFNSSLDINYVYGKKYLNFMSLNLGSNVFQFDNDNQINHFNNTLSTLRWTNNYMKIYEARFIKFDYTKGLGNGLTLNTSINFQHRLPLENTTNYYWTKVDGREFTANFPTTIASSNITEHKALSLSGELIWRPGGRYVEFPDRKISIGSRFPTFRFSFTQGLKNVLGSDVDYSKWQFGINDNLNLKIAGRLSYRITAGGFAHATNVSIPDMNHLRGNQIVSAAPYLQSFQLLPYYTYSNTSKLFSTAHVEYHLNGLITNKIPGFKKLNWFFVIGGNAFYDNDKKQGYYEALFSVENILKVFRLDFIKSFQSSQLNNSFGIKFSAPLIPN